MASFDFGKYLRNLKGQPPSGMIDPHAHRILFKKGLGHAQQVLVQEGQSILLKRGIDPIFGPENLIWAPWRVHKQHGTESLQTVVQALRTLDGLGGSREQFVQLLKRLGDDAATRK